MEQNFFRHHNNLFIIMDWISQLFLKGYHREKNMLHLRNSQVKIVTV